MEAEVRGAPASPGTPRIAGSTRSWETDEEGSPSAGASAADILAPDLRPPAPGETTFLFLTPQSVDLPSTAQDTDVPATLTLPGVRPRYVTCTHVLLGPAGASPAPLTRARAPGTLLGAPPALPWPPSPPLLPATPRCPGHLHTARGRGHGASRRAALALETHRHLAHEGAQGSLLNSRGYQQVEKVGSLPGTPPRWSW